MTDRTRPPLPSPMDYCYEWDGPYGTRKFSAALHNGAPPSRSVPIYTADQMRQYADDANAALKENLQSSVDFYQRRCVLLQKWQSKMRDPERTIVCDILANAQTLPDPTGDRYEVRDENAALREINTSLCRKSNGYVIENARLAEQVRVLREALLGTVRELQACQSVIHLAGGFDPAYVSDAQVALKAARAALEASK